MRVDKKIPEVVLSGAKVEADLPRQSFSVDKLPYSLKRLNKKINK